MYYTLYTICSTLGLYGPSGLHMVAEGGGISLSAYRDIKIGSSEGKVIQIEIMHKTSNHIISR